MLVPTTSFFRDPSSFEALRRDLLPQLIARHEDGDHIRVWSAGCSTGEEAYSLAMLFLEHSAGRPFLVLASDVSERAIATVRAGRYPARIRNTVSPARLERFFTRLDGEYRIGKTVRDHCLFARHDLTRDPPFSRSVRHLLREDRRRPCHAHTSIPYDGRSVLQPIPTVRGEG
jgi:two-component system CheB/CheR fusion protein